MSLHTLENLPPRPPTPPLESSHDPMSDAPLQPTLVRQPFDPRLSLQTPPNGAHSPNSSASHSNLSSRTRRKNVAFAPLSQYKEAPNYDAENRECPSSAPPVPSAKASRPQKGILKPFSSPTPLDISFNAANGVASLCSLHDMLDSSLRQLAGDDRGDRIDAYDTLSRALKASNNLPDRVALQDRMPRFMEFIQRDIPTSPPHPTLTNHALTFLSTILYFPGVSSSLTTEFCNFVIDHCTRSFGDSTVPKDVSRRLLQVVAQQNFSPRVMTLDRVGRLLTSLNNIENHVTGKSIIHSRIMIYRRLMSQCRPAMLAHTGWLRDLLTDTLSTTKDIRGAAIVFGFEASLSVGKERQVSRKLAELFRSTSDDQESEHNQEPETKREYIDLYIERLKAMLRSRQEAPSVPRIWSVILLLLRGIQLDRWQSLNPWLHVIQHCFNTSDMQTRQEANYAWNRFVYVLHFEESSFSKLLGSTLCQPVRSQWKRKTKTDEGFQTTIFGSACNLFYYMFKPGTSHAQLDRYWDLGFKPVIQQLCVPGRGEDRYDQAICILTSLFDATTRRQWVEDRVMTNPLADASELPALDPKWLRRNAARVFQLVQPILERRFDDLADRASSTSKMWQTLVTSVSSAASKEIKVSFETTDFISHVFTSLLALWKRGVAKPVEGQDAEKLRRTFLASVREFVAVVVTTFGVLPFTEKQLCSRQDVFTPVTTPSHRPTKTNGVVTTPLHHLFSLLSSTPGGVEDDEVFSEFFGAVFKPFFRAKNPRTSSELAQEMLNSTPLDSHCPCGPWILVSDTVKVALSQGRARNKSSLGTPSSDEMPVGREYRDLCKILERGLKSTPNLPWSKWSELLTAVEVYVSEETGHAGCALAVVEPLAKMVLDHVTALDEGVSLNAVLTATALLHLANQPRDRQAVDAARKRLWGTTSAKSPSFDPFDSLYKLSNFIMEDLYKSLGSSNIADEVALFMEGLERFLAHCNSSLVMRSISILQDGLVFWVKDDQSRLSSRQTAETAAATKQTWDRICSIIASQESLAATSLDSLERLFCAAFQSKHRHVVNSMAILWNRIFDNAEEIAYPEELKATLIAVRPMVDIILPGLEEPSEESAASAQQHAFVESQDDMNALNISPAKSSRSEKVRLVPSGSLATPAPFSRRSDGPNAAGAQLPRDKRRTRPKLRHEDSQIQFEPIESTSLDEAESQHLTERQLEVRERQRGQDEIYNIRSSSPVHEDGLRDEDVPSSPPQLPEAGDITPKKRTPVVQSTYDDYINTTPTPRRGKMLPLVLDVEMSDPPSSPPEFSQVRRYPLVPEIQSRSSKEEVNWDYASSPVSGSPPPPQLPPPQESDGEEVQGQEQEQAENETEGQEAEEEHEEEDHEQESARPQATDGGARDDTDVAVADSFATDAVPSSVPVENKPTESSQGAEEDKTEAYSAPSSRRTRRSARTSSKSTPSTSKQPSSTRRSSTRRAANSSRSKSDEFVDAPTSPEQGVAEKAKEPAPNSSRQSVDTSFALSEAAERSMIRLAEEMEASHKETGNKQSSKAARRRTRSSKGSVAEFMTNKAGGGEEGGKEQRTPVRRSERVIPSTPHAATPSEPGSRRSTGGGRKRKRAPAARQQEARAKRQRSGLRADDGASANSTPSHQQRQESRPQEEDEDVHSQVISEHLAAASQSRLSPELGDDTSLSQSNVSEVEMGEPGEQATEASPRTPESGRASRSRSVASDASIRKKRPAYKIERHLKRALERMQTAAISREEMHSIEDMFVDFKRELYDAERRGRQE